MRALVYGLARSGRSAAERLAERGDEVVLVDRSLGNEDDVSLLDGVDVVVKSPGVPGSALLVSAARERRIDVWSEVELGYRLLPGAHLIGVTGTNGKTTTTELLGAIFRVAGRDVAVAGNVGTPLTSIRAADWVICELSSFQLEDVHELACDVAVLLNLEPDHLDRHGSFEAYRDAKLRIFERARVKVDTARARARRRRVLRGRRSAGRAAAPRRAQPRERRSRHRRCARGRDRRRSTSPRRFAASRGCRIDSSSSRSEPESGS